MKLLQANRTLQEWLSEEVEAAVRSKNLDFQPRLEPTTAPSRNLLARVDRQALNKLRGMLAEREISLSAWVIFQAETFAGGLVAQAKGRVDESELTDQLLKILDTQLAPDALKTVRRAVRQLLGKRQSDQRG